MKIGEQGEAFFVVEVDDEDERNQIPDDLVTSPILSATTSPMASPGFEPVPPVTSAAQPGDAKIPVSASEVEPLDLGESSTRGKTTEASDTEVSASPKSLSATNKSEESNDTGVTTPTEERNDPARSSGDADDVPDDSGLSGSGPEAGTSSLLSRFGTAASKAGGAVGAVGRAVGVKGDNIRLDKLAAKADRADKDGYHTGAHVDNDKESAHEFDPQSSNPPGKQRQPQADEDTPPGATDVPANETEALEQKMKDRAEKLISDEESLLSADRDKRSRDPTKESVGEGPGDTSEGEASSSRHGEESYPAPFGDTGAAKSKKLKEPTRQGSNTFPVAQSDHQQFLAGRRLRSDGTAAEFGVEPTQVDVRSVEGRIRAAKEQQTGDGDLAHTSGDSDPKDETRNADRVAPLKRTMSAAERRKEDLQYLFDMDGYKMTADGEDLAFAEGHRLADEMPLSRRHGGKEFHPHIGELLDQAHRRERMAEHIASTGTGEAQIVAADQTGPPPLRSDQEDGEQHTAAGTSAFSHQSHQNSNALAEDFARLAALLSSDNGHAGQQSRLGVKANDMGQDDDAETQAPKRSTRQRRHTQEVSLSDTEADLHADEDEDRDIESSSVVPSARRSYHLRAKSGPFDISSNVALRSGLPGDATPPKVFDESSLRERRREGAWQWGEPGQRQRVLSSAAAEDLDNDSTKYASGSEGSARFYGDAQDPYIFRIVLDSSERSFQMSLCYKEGFGATEASEEERDEFQDARISFQRFIDDPDVVNDERLALLYDGHYYNWESSAAVLATLSLYRSTFASAGVDDSAVSGVNVIRDDQGPRPSVWSRWWNRNSKQASQPYASNFERENSAPPESGSTHTRPPVPIERVQSDTALLSTTAEAEQASSKGATAKNTAKPEKTFAKTLRLTSDQLKSLNLKKGANSITFSVTSSYSGVATCTARIFLWESTHHIVVSDIDGTITKSDALGHVFTMIGRDWTHLGVAKLYTDIARNGYRIMYLTSRAIGQADTTRDYLRGINQNNYRLPDGPVIMSPDRLIASLHREVILRKPEVFKMACLRDIARLFGADPRRTPAHNGGVGLPRGQGEIKPPSAAGAVGNISPSAGAATAPTKETDGEEANDSTNPNAASTPFYAGFGNRITDALSYRSVNIPSSRIFTIDTNGEVKMELLELAGYKSSYIHMTDLVDQMFPPITQKSSEKKSGKPEYNDFNYWRPQMAEFELPPDDELMPTPPVSPALSARSGRSVRSMAGSVRSATSGSGVPADAEQQQQSRLGRFGLGSLGLSRKSSTQTIATSEPSGVQQGASSSRPLTHSASTSEALHGVIDKVQDGASASAEPSAEGNNGAHRANSAPPESSHDVPLGSSPSSFGTGPTSWMAPWRRRAASPGGGPSSPTQATSPLVGPVITAEPESDDEELEGDDDDDVSSFEGNYDGDDFEHGSDGGDDDEEEDEEYEDEEAERGSVQEGENDESLSSDRANTGTRPRSGRVSRRRGVAPPQGDHTAQGVDDVDDEDELLAAGDIRFDWRA